MDQVTQVREKIDIVALISEYLPVKKAGRNFKTNCPFHNEKTPSFVISPERQIWHCFGCGKGGDCYSFLMEYENLEFPEALRILAKKTGIELEQTHFETGATSKKEKIYNLNRLVCEFYHYLLVKHNVGKKALDYLSIKRKVKPSTINTYMLGFAPRIGNALSTYLINKKKYKKEDLLEAGLVSFRNGRIVDFFTHRLMFSLFDHRGNVVGFSGRVLEDNSLTVGSKYVNTRETLVYHKGSVFFGLNIAKNTIKKENCAIVMEGEFDVISSFQEGVSNAIAVKGSALTEEQVNLLARFTQKVSLCFDQDNAGQEAIKRSLPILEKKGITATVVLIPNGKDPDESIKNDPLIFRKTVKNDMGIYDYFFSKTLSSFNKNNIEGKKKIGDELLPIFGNIENEIVKEHYLKKLANELEISYESVLKQMQRMIKKETDVIGLKQSKDKRLREEILEEYLSALILQAESPKSTFEKVNSILQGFLFNQSVYLKIFNQLSVFLKENLYYNHGKFLSLLPSELIPAFDVCCLFPLPKFIDKKAYEIEVEKVSKELKALYLRLRIKDISQKIKNKEKIENFEEDEELKTLKEEFESLILLLQDKL